MGSKAMPGFQVMTDLLTIREKNVIYSLIRPQWTLMKATVAQVLESAEDSGAPAWKSSACGVLCAVRDETLDSYFLRLFCVQRAELLWEHEIYVPFKYTVSRTYFHTFPVDGHQAGFNFADDTEAEEFHFAVEFIKEHLASLSFQDTTETIGSSSEDTTKRNCSSESCATSEKSDQPVNTERRTSCPEVSPTTTSSAFDLLKDSELDVFLRRLFRQSRLTEEDLRSRSVTDIVEHIIAQFGGPQSVQRELYTRGSGAMTLPRSSSSSLAMKKGPLPRTPSFSGRPTKQDPPLYSHTAPASVPAVGAAILSALQDVFRQKELQQREEGQYENTK